MWYRFSGIARTLIRNSGASVHHTRLCRSLHSRGQRNQTLLCASCDEFHPTVPCRSSRFTISRNHNTPEPSNRSLSIRPHLLYLTRIKTNHKKRSLCLPVSSALRSSAFVCLSGSVFAFQKLRPDSGRSGYQSVLRILLRSRRIRLVPLRKDVR